MLAPERRNQILNLVIQKKSVLVKDLSMMFDVTGETIRKDLAVLVKRRQNIKDVRRSVCLRRSSK